MPFAGPDGLATGLPLADAPGEIGLCLRGRAGLGQRDPLADRMQAAVAAPVAAVTHPLGRGGLLRGDAGRGGERCSGGAAAAGPKDTGERRGGEQRDAAAARERGESGRGQGAALGRERLRLLARQAEALRSSAHGGRPLLVHGAGVGARGGFQRAGTRLGPQPGQLLGIVRIELEQALVGLIAQARRFRDGPLAR